MTGFVMRPRIFPPIQGELDDTKLSCKRVSTYKYVHGQARPNHPVPATIESANIAIDYLLLSVCPYTDGPCLICIEKYIDSIEYTFFPD